MMRFLRSTLAALMTLTLVAGTAMATTTNDPSTNPAPEVTAETGASEGPGSITDEVTDEATGEDTGENTDGSTAKTGEKNAPNTVTDYLYEAKIGGKVIAITQPEGEKPGTITLQAGSKEVTLTYTAGMLEGKIAEGSYVEVKGTTQAITKIEVADEEDKDELTIKTAIAAITPAGEGRSATITLMIGGQPITFTADELGIPADAVALLAVGAEFKLETEDGETEVKISGEQGTIKIEVEEDGTIEVKVEKAGEKENGKGQEISEQKQAEKAEREAEKQAEKAKHEAEKQAEKAEREAEKQAEKAKHETEKQAKNQDDDDDDDDEHEVGKKAQKAKK